MTPYEAAAAAYEQNDLPENALDTEGILRGEYAAFRGTESLTDVITDIRARAGKFHGVLVHVGFREAYLAVANVVREYACRQDTLHLVGHSLGGAIAVLAALDLHRLFPAMRLHLTTFGAPRVGEAALRRAMAGVAQTRYANPLDPVTHVPHLLLPGIPAFHSCEPIRAGRWLPPWHRLSAYRPD